MNTTAYFQILQKNVVFSRNYKIFLLLLLITIQFSTSQTLAFPEANGFGKNATGGRGGEVIKVTNLNASGPGSFKEACQAEGKRTIVFDVGGTIDLDGTNIYISNGNLTIAGQTAPGDGILIKGGMIQVEASNVIIRYLRVRHGESGSGYDAFSVTAWNGVTLEDIIIDHCSFSWGDDENVNFRTAGGSNGSSLLRNITLQNCLIGESQYAVLNGGGRTYNLSIYNNLFVLNQDRHIRSQGSGYLGNTFFDFEMINNVIYGFDSNSNFSYGHKMSAINNHWKPSTEVSDDSYYLYKTLPEFGGVLSDTQAYITGNTVPTGHGEFESELTPFITSSPYDSSGIVPVAAVDIEIELLPHVGASFPIRDEVDVRLINHYNTGDGSLNEPRIFPTIAGGAAPIDSDDDGMPDFWEDANGLNKNDPNDRNIVQPDGYTNLEYYLNGLINPDDSLNANAGADQSICEGSSATLTASGGDTYLWSTGETTSTITVSPATTTTFTVTAFIDGESDTDDVTVTVNEIPTANAGNNQEICFGEAATLSAFGGDSYLWNTGETSSTISVSPDDTTTYTVVVTSNGCSDSDEVQVTVLDNPTAEAGNDVTINSGETITLDAFGGDSYLWNTGDTSQSIDVSPDTTTIYTVTVFQGNCEDSDSVTVTVNSNEVSAYAGEDENICEGESVTLTASGGTDYLWSTGETTQSIEVSPEMTTNYTVIVSNATSSDTAEVTVGVSPIPELEVSNDITILEGPEYYTLSVSGADRYEWSNGATDPNIAVSPNTTTTYVVTGYIEDCYDVKSITVNVEQQVYVELAEVAPMCQGDEITLTANSSGGDAFLWNTGETTQTINVSPEESTTYTVIVSNSLDSMADEVMVIVESCQEEIIPEEEFSFEVYTNPRSNVNTLKVKIDGVSNYCQLYLFDVTGKLLHSDTFIATEGQEIVRDINTSNISNGVYIMKLIEKNGTHSKNFLVR